MGACDCVGGFSCHKDSCGPPMKSLDSCDGPWEAQWIAPRSRECNPLQDRNDLCTTLESCINCEDHSGAERKILFGAFPTSGWGSPDFLQQGSNGKIPPTYSSSPCGFCGVPFVAY